MTDQYNRMSPNNNLTYDIINLALCMSKLIIDLKVTIDLLDVHKSTRVINGIATRLSSLENEIGCTSNYNTIMNLHVTY